MLPEPPSGRISFMGQAADAYPGTAGEPARLLAEAWHSVEVNPRLIDDEELARSSVVANCAMNRERQLAGPNSYARELRFHPLDWLRARLAGSAGSSERTVAWLDLCCGTGHALAQAAWELRQDGLADRVTLVGVDLVDYFAPAGDLPLRFISAPVTAWAPDRDFDLITCVHGLHYVGDKLTALTRAASWLTSDGLLVADLDLASVKLPDGRPAGRPLASALRQAGFAYNPRQHRVTRDGHGKPSLPYAYLGADHQAGPNYTGQPAIDSYYERQSKT